MRAGRGSGQPGFEGLPPTRAQAHALEGLQPRDGLRAHAEGRGIHGGFDGDHLLRLVQREPHGHLVHRRARPQGFVAVVQMHEGFAIPQAALDIPEPVGTRKPLELQRALVHGLAFGGFGQGHGAGLRLRPSLWNARGPAP